MSENESEPRVGDRVSVTVYGNVDYIDKNFIALEVSGVGVIELDLPDNATHVKILSRKQVEVGDEIFDVETLNNLPHGSIVWAGHGFLPGYCEGVDTWVFPGNPARHNSATLLWGNRTVRLLALGR